jgi:hypothetical protein
MKPVYYLLLIFALCVNSSAIAQQHYAISGTVADEKDQPVKSATVFISGTEKITMTDDAGRFTFYNIDAGTFTVSVSMLGYFPYAQNVIIKTSDVKVDITLKVKAIILDEVVIGGRDNWARNFKIFKAAFLGSSANGKQAVILNPKVINFSTKKGVLLADADEFLIIENKRLGYHIKYLLKDFSYNSAQGGLSLYTGETVFEEMQGDEKMKKEWAKNRLETYKGSLMHFLRSVYANKPLSEGFLTRQMISYVPIFGREKPTFLNRVFLDPRTVDLDTIVTTVDTSFKKLKFTTFYILYDPKHIDNEIVKKGDFVPYKKSVQLDDLRGSIVKLQLDEAIIDRKGSYTNYRAFYIEGAIGRKRVGDQLPVEYQPQ